MDKHIPMRTCIGCHKVKDKSSLNRIVKTKNLEVIYDPSGTHKGRGAYICSDTDCLKKALKKRTLDRTFRMAVADDIYDQLREIINE